MIRERNTRWGIDILRGKIVERAKVSFGEAFRREYAGNKERFKKNYTVSN